MDVFFHILQKAFYYSLLKNQATGNNLSLVEPTMVKLVPSYRNQG